MNIKDQIIMIRNKLEKILNSKTSTEEDKNNYVLLLSELISLSIENEKTVADLKGFEIPNSINHEDFIDKIDHLIKFINDHFLSGMDQVQFINNH